MLPIELEWICQSVAADEGSRAFPSDEVDCSNSYILTAQGHRFPAAAIPMYYTGMDAIPQAVWKETMPLPLPRTDIYFRKVKPQPAPAFIYAPAASAARRTPVIITWIDQTLRRHFRFQVKRTATPGVYLRDFASGWCALYAGGLEGTETVAVMLCLVPPGGYGERSARFRARMIAGALRGFDVQWMNLRTSDPLSAARQIRKHVPEALYWWFGSLGRPRDNSS